MPKREGIIGLLTKRSRIPKFRHKRQVIPHNRPHDIPSNIPMSVPLHISQSVVAHITHIPSPPLLSYLPSRHSQSTNPHTPTPQAPSTLVHHSAAVPNPHQTVLHQPGTWAHPAPFRCGNHRYDSGQSADELERRCTRGFCLGGVCVCLGSGRIPRGRI